MRHSSLRRGRPTAAAIAALTALAIFALLPAAAGGATGRLFVVVRVADNLLAESPARASVVTADGRLIDYDEQLLVRAPNERSFQLEGLPEGAYDVRVEGEGLITEVKRGVPVFAERAERVAVVVRPGEGLHVVEYAIACLAREEVAARLGALEGELARLRTELASLTSQP